MENDALDIILGLYKNDNLTKEEAGILLDHVHYNKPTVLPFNGTRYDYNEQPKWTITTTNTQ